jgi:hypothetical protein
VLDDQETLDRLHFVVGAETEHVWPAVRGGVDPAPLVTREGSLLVVGGHDVLAQLRAERLQHIAQVARDREVAQNRPSPLQEVIADDAGDRRGGCTHASAAKGSHPSGGSQV